MVFLQAVRSEQMIIVLQYMSLNRLWLVMRHAPTICPLVKTNTSLQSDLEDHGVRGRLLLHFWTLDL